MAKHLFNCQGGPGARWSLIWYASPLVGTGGVYNTSCGDCQGFRIEASAGQALLVRVYAEVCRALRNRVHFSWWRHCLRECMQRCVESLETYFILGQKSSPLSLAINYLYRLEQVHVQQFGSVWTKVKTDVSFFPFPRPWSLSGTGAHGRVVRRLWV